MPANIRRHSVLMSDIEVEVVGQAVTFFARVMAMLPVSKRTERIALRAADAIRGHRHCTCPVPPESVP